MAVLHDADGRIVALGDLRFTYDANGQLVELRRRGRRLARYGYDSRGQRTRNCNHSGLQPITVEIETHSGCSLHPIVGRSHVSLFPVESD